MKFILLSFESLRFALGALKANLTRTILSLVGVMIGIFAIIGVLMVVDSLERNIQDSFNFLGEDVIYVQKWPWIFDGDTPWWDYINRPHPTKSEYEFLSEYSRYASAISLFTNRGGITMKRASNSIKDTQLQGVSFDHNRVFEMNIEKGRYFTREEVEAGRNVAILGATIAEALFPNNENPIGKSISIRGLKHFVIGTIAEEGESFLGVTSNDEICYVPYSHFLKLYSSRRRSGVPAAIGIKGYEDDIGLVELENEVVGLMRRKRGLKPKEEEDFAVNRPEFLANVIGGVFDVMSFVGAIIGGFSILVGGFGIANIMFVSVKERTNQIGIQKSLGAKNYFILNQFLFESILLSIIGGAAGILLVYLLSILPFGSFEINLSFVNVLTGFTISTIIGVLSGIIPAIIAARLDPVIAIRTN